MREKGVGERLTDWLIFIKQGMPAGQPVLNKIITTYNTAKRRNKMEFKKHIYIYKKLKGGGAGGGKYFEKVQNGNHMRAANQT